MKPVNLEYLGTGIGLPFTINSLGDVSSVSGLENIRSAVRLLLGTQKGELRWDPDYGLDMTTLLHRPFVESLGDEAGRLVREGFTREPRVRIGDVTAELKDGELLQLTVFYEVVGGVVISGQRVFEETVIFTPPV